MTLEIPAGRFCDSRGEVDVDEKWLYSPTECGFLKGNECHGDACGLFRVMIDDSDPFVGYRCPQCLAEYPHGGTITIEAKP